MVGKIVDPLCGHEYHVLFVSSAAVSDMERLSVFPVRTGDWDPDARAVYHARFAGRIYNRHHAPAYYEQHPHDRSRHHRVLYCEDL